MSSVDIQSAPLPAHDLDTSAKELPILHSNQGSHIAPASTGWMLPTPRDTPVSEMRARFARDGYLWVKNVLPRDAVLDMRERCVSSVSPKPILFKVWPMTYKLSNTDISPKLLLPAFSAPAALLVTVFSIRKMIPWLFKV